MLKKSIKKTDNEIEEINMHGEYDLIKSQLANELREVKAEWRKIYYNKIEKQKVLIEKHSAVVDHRRKCRKYYQYINAYKNLSEEQKKEIKIENQDQILSQEMLEKMEKEVQQANDRRLQEERKYEGKSKNLIIIRKCNGSGKEDPRQRI